MPINFYDAYSLPAYEGQMPNNRGSGQFIGLIEQARASVPIMPGRFVFRTTSDGALAVSNTGVAVANILGVSIAPQFYEKSYRNTAIDGTRFTSASGVAGTFLANNQPFFDTNEPVAILRKGYVWVIAESALPLGTTAFQLRTADPTANANTNLAIGRLNTAIVGSTQIAVTGTTASSIIQVVRPAAANGGLALIYIDFSSNTSLV